MIYQNDKKENTMNQFLIELKEQMLDGLFFIV